MERDVERALIMVEGPWPGQRYPIGEELLTIGRAPDNTIVIKDARISRYHARVRLAPGGIVVEDLGSTNGTFVNGSLLTGPHRLSADERITLADYVTFRFVAATDASAAPTPHVWPISPAKQGVPMQIPSAAPETPPPFAPPTPTPPTRPSVPPIEAEDVPRWLYVIIIILVLLICLIVGLAIYLWFASAEFWQNLGIRLPLNLGGFKPVFVEDLARAVLPRII